VAAVNAAARASQRAGAPQERDMHRRSMGDRAERRDHAAAGRRGGEGIMADGDFRESFKAGTTNVMARLKELLHEGNVRRVVIQHEGRIVAEFPLTAGVVGVVLAPVLAAIGALLALLQDCTITVEREPRASDDPGRRADAGTGGSQASS
jgi:hypothetical protein